MNTLLVTSTEAGTGKTAVALALARLATERGDDVGYMKPKGTRLESNVGKTLDADPMLARELLGLDAEMHELEPVVYSPTFVEGAIRGRENPAELRERVRDAFDGLAEEKDLMVVEGADDLATGGIVDLTDADVAKLLDAEVVVLSKYSEPGDVDDVLAAAEDLGDRCAGVVFNAVQDAVYDDVETDVAPFLDGRDVPVLGVLPRDADLAGVTVEDLATELGAEVLTEDGAGTDERVERFLVGAMSGEAALSHFRRTKDAAVITGGDRADVQTAALDAPGVTCLVLTGGHRPSGAVLGKAAESGVPVLSVQSDTLTTVERAEELVRGGRVRDEHTVDRMQELLYDHADVDALLD
ncbi:MULTISPECIES: phosphotransacetylase family protein [Halobacterium]|uniref:phosphotransacetylase family protein n=1 Tax=Halobacterium TaxID=2239 RepID=UPI00073F5685|nr:MULTISPECIES: phosphotransacetylase family protein [Halobacterium]MCG1002935.1 phosphotransacetylase family protein [Halobacterium noricense]